MGRPLRATAGGVIYHVLNRANARQSIFEKSGDYLAFERVLVEAHARLATRILAYCLMPNHWHLVLWPVRDGELTEFSAWVTLTHTQRWHAHHQSAGTGHVYQGRFRSFPVEEDNYLLTVCRYVERNALRAGLVSRAENWRWSSLWHRTRREGSQPTWLAPWPVELPANWLDWINQAQTSTELEAIRVSVQRGRPYGSSNWVQKTADRLNLGNTLRLTGRPSTGRRHGAFSDQKGS